MRKVIAGVVQGEALFVGVAGNSAGVPVGAAGRCGFGMRWSGGPGGRWLGWEGCISVRIGWWGRGLCGEAGVGVAGAVGGRKVSGMGAFGGKVLGGGRRGCQRWGGGEIPEPNRVSLHRT